METKIISENEIVYVKVINYIQNLIFVLVLLLLLLCLAVFFNKGNSDLPQTVFYTLAGNQIDIDTIQICSNLKRKSVSNLMPKTSGSFDDFEDVYNEFLTAAWRNVSRIKLPSAHSQPGSDTEANSFHLDASSDLFQPDHFADTDLSDVKFHRMFWPFVTGASDEEDMILGLECDGCYPKSLIRFSSVDNYNLCHDLSIMTENQVRNSSDDDCSNRKFKIKMILNLESFDSDPEVKVTLKYPIFDQIVISKGTTTDVSLSLSESSRNFEVMVSKTEHSKPGLVDNHLNMFVTLKAGKYLHKSCFVFPGRRKLIELIYPGICTLLNKSLDFGPNDDLVIKDATYLPKLYHLIDNFSKDNFAFVTVQVTNRLC